jgi:hypothetical protein
MQPIILFFDKIFFIIKKFVEISVDKIALTMVSISIFFSFINLNEKYNKAITYKW